MENLNLESILDNIVESILFISGEGVLISDISEKLGVEIKDIQNAVEKLKTKYSEQSGIQLVSYNNKIQFSSNPQYSNFVESVLNPIREKALTKATLETIAIIAYKQPITRLEIEEIRGVSSDYSVQVLIEHNLIEMVGRKDAPGKPILFGTTDEFLKRFNLPNLNSLPQQEDLMERIKLVKENSSNSLYNDFKLPDEEKENENEEIINIDLDETDENLEEESMVKEKILESMLEDEVPAFLKSETNLQKVE
ncbi:MAG: SMC-Scp complex subunit ScpB [Clostridia bacterium]